MDTGQSRRLWLTLGGGVAVVLVSLLVAFAILRRDHGSSAPPPASTGGLVVQMGRPDDARPDPKTPLRCFVAGQFVGMETLDSCARKNGVATQALDVGVDSSGALAAAGDSAGGVSPLPSAADAGAPTGSALTDMGGQADRYALGDCMRFSGVDWRRVSDGVSLSACVQTLFAGRCERLGGASYGRWMGQTLRLVPHRVEISADNRAFHPLVDQADATCAIPEF